MLAVVSTAEGSSKVTSPGPGTFGQVTPGLPPSGSLTDPLRFTLAALPDNSAR